MPLTTSPPRITRAASPTTGPDRRWGLVPLAVLVIGLLGWEIGARNGWISPIFYPAPTAVAQALVRLVESGRLGAALAASASRILAGFGIGTVVGLPLGLAMGWSPAFRRALDPLVAAAHPVPRLALLPLVLLLFGIGETARVVVVALSCVFPLLINASAGVRQIEPVHFEVARSFGAGRLATFVHVVVPGSVPSLLAGARLALVSAFKTTLGIELITAGSGLGHLLWLSWEAFRPDELYATLAVVALVGFAMSTALSRLVSALHRDHRGAPR